MPPREFFSHYRTRQTNPHRGRKPATKVLCLDCGKHWIAAKTQHPQCRLCYEKQRFQEQQTRDAALTRILPTESAERTIWAHGQEYIVVFDGTR